VKPAALLAYSGLAVVSTISAYQVLTSQVLNRSAEVSKPPFTTIMMCTLKEEGFVEKAIRGLEDQNIVTQYPDCFERIIVDSNSEDNTVAIAEDYGWNVIQAPRGKLTARHIGIEKAKGKVIVGVDADTRYGCNWLNLMLRHFQNPRVVGVIGPRIGDPEEGILLSGMSVWLSLVDLSPIAGLRMPAQSGAFTKEAYYKVGGFNLDINQQNMHEMVREEEIAFPMRLRRIGLVITDLQATVFTSMRRTLLMPGGQHFVKWRQERSQGLRF
jgi:glycosyltransferase involved in cell wall biosynthesis